MSDDKIPRKKKAMKKKTTKKVSPSKKEESEGLSDEEKAFFHDLLKTSSEEFGPVIKREEVDDNYSMDKVAKHLHNQIDHHLDGFVLIGVTPKGDDFYLTSFRQRRDLRAVKSMISDFIHGNVPKSVNLLDDGDDEDDHIFE